MICSCAGAAGGGAQQPVAPGARLVVVAGVHQRQQRERGVAQPAVAVVPVARAADLLGQRRRRRRDDAAGRRVGQRLEGDQRAHDRVAPTRRSTCSAPPTRARTSSVASSDDCGSIASGGGTCDGPYVRTNGTVSPAATSNSATVVRSSPCSARRRVQHHHVRTRDRAQRPVLQARDPGHRAAVVEAQHQLHAHPHAPAVAAHQPHDVGVAAARRHEVDDRRRRRRPSRCASRGSACRRDSGA